MAITFPLPVRVAAGLVAAGMDRIRHLPEDLPALSVTVAGQAVRASMRVQQEIAQLAGRGDEVLAGLTNRPTERPAWAHFDEEDEPDTVSGTAGGSSGTTGGAPAAPKTAGGSPGSPKTAGGPSGQSPSGQSPSGSGASSPASNPADGPDGSPADGPGGDGAARSGKRPPAPRAPRRTATIRGARPRTSAPGDAAATPGGHSPAPASAGSEPAVLPGYDAMTLAQVRARLRGLSPDAVTALLDRERTGAARAAYLTLLTNRLTSLQAGDGQDPLR